MDLNLYDKVDSFLPKNIFDAHVHIGQCGNEIYTADTFLESQKEFFPNAETISGNLIPYPDMSLRDKKKRYESAVFMKEQLDSYNDFFGEVMVLPGDTKEEIEALLIHPRIRGLKCYHFYADREDVDNADIEEFLPETALEVANERGLCITLHLVKDKALADAKNLNYLKINAEKYPNAKFILSHCAHGFASWTLVETVKELKEYMNVYYDVSSVCESPTIYACIRTVGVKRVLWGSDYFSSCARGKCVSLGDGFVWIMEDDFKRINKRDIEVNTIQTESLHALMQACHMLQLTKNDVDNLFYYNALGLFVK
ncbi:MAG: amidohydrolase family protein [Clostridia bacterium]|nr:amidohydrolase family protein [Clostridia bacterium]